MTKDDFEKGYCERSAITIDEYREHFITLPCNCEHIECEGWASVTNNELVINNHQRKYM